MSTTYYVALPFMYGDDGISAGAAQECQNAGAAVRRAEALARTPPNIGALAFQRSGDPNLGQFDDAKLIRSFGEVPTQLDEL